MGEGRGEGLAALEALLDIALPAPHRALVVHRRGSSTTSPWARPPRPQPPTHARREICPASTRQIAARTARLVVHRPLVRRQPLAISRQHVPGKQPVQRLSRLAVHEPRTLAPVGSSSSGSSTCTSASRAAPSASRRKMGDNAHSKSRSLTRIRTPHGRSVNLGNSSLKDRRPSKSVGGRALDRRGESPSQKTEGVSPCARPMRERSWASSRARSRLRSETPSTAKRRRGSPPAAPLPPCAPEDRLAGARHRVPVDVPQVVAGLVLAEVVQLERAADLRLARLPTLRSARARHQHR